MSKSSKKSLDRKHLTYDRLKFLYRRIGELERVRIPTRKQLILLKRYRLEYVKLFVMIT
jgi:preprotein translocase subunit SecE